MKINEKEKLSILYLFMYMYGLREVYTTIWFYLLTDCRYKNWKRSMQMYFSKRNEIINNNW